MIFYCQHKLLATISLFTIQSASFSRLASYRSLGTLSCSLDDRSIKNVAIVGGGFAGLGCAYHSSQHKAKITLCDPFDPGTGGASSIAAGMLHPFTPQGKLIWRGDEGIEATYNILSKIKNDVAFDNRFIYRPCFNENHKNNFEKAICKYPEWIEWISKTDYVDKFGILPEDKLLGAVKIKKSKIIDCKKYLQSLWEYIVIESNFTASWKSQKITHIKELSDNYDLVFLTVGGEIKELLPELSLPIKLVRGQSLLYDQLENNSVFTNAILCGEYVVPNANHQIICGATREYANTWEELNAAPNIEVAKNLLLDKITSLYSPLGISKPIGCTAGVRVNPVRSHLGKIPLVGRHPVYKNVWILTGLGSRGLIHHALLSDLLVQAAWNNDEELLPLEASLSL